MELKELIMELKEKASTCNTSELSVGECQDMLFMIDELVLQLDDLVSALEERY